MNCYITYIGVIDKLGRVHSVNLKPGLNIITGKSSTGKSALMEIFDYCFGSSDFTVPVGVITENADMYFVSLRFLKTTIVLARKPDSSKAFIREVADFKDEENPAVFPQGFFEEKLFLTLTKFKKELAGYFGLTITDVDLDEAEKDFRGKKSPSPSIRSFTSFMLQHQNLVANKHAVFYRFDEKEKREQTIDHVKVFLGFADQSYFLLSQDLNNAKVELRKLEYALPKKNEEDAQRLELLTAYLNEFSSITGKHLLDELPAAILNNPFKWMEHIKSQQLVFDSASDEYTTQIKNSEAIRARLVSELRGLERDRSAIRSSIDYAEEYAQKISKLDYPHKADDYVTECPFCRQSTNAIELEANNLTSAIDWLNDQLSRSPHMKGSFQSEERRLNKAIEKKQVEVRSIEEKISHLRSQIHSVTQRQSLFELALKAKLRVENFLEDLCDGESTDIANLIEKKQEEIKGIQKKIDRYGIKEKMVYAESFIAKTMNDIGSRLDFEESYKPVKLEFSLETFDLWNNRFDRKVYLRSMGSGANWLYCHLVLFMALHKLFCSLRQACKIPPILFLDQPTQVYFPNISLDTKAKFDAKELVPADKQAKVDHDVKSVERFFSEIADFCELTEKETGQKPQIIVTDHADNLNLEGGKIFNSYVRERWRDYGFIH